MQDFRNIIKDKRIRDLGKCILFFTILIAMIVGLSIGLNMLSRKNDNLTQSRNKSLVQIQNEKEDTVDLLVLGDSLSFCSFAPMRLWSEYGITSFVGAQSAQMINESYFMLKIALKTQKPKVVIMETNTFFRAQDKLDGAVKLITNEFNYYLPIFRFHSVWKPLLFGMDYGEENYKGFMIRDAINPYTGGQYMNETTDKWEISDGVKLYVDRINALCKEKGIKLILVSTPSPKNCNYQKHNAIMEYAKDNSLTYIDMNLMLDELGIDWSLDSLDKGDHLNLSGAYKVSDYIGKYLRDNYNIPDHRTDEAYKKWEKTSEKYESAALNKLNAMEEQWKQSKS